MLSPIIDKLHDSFRILANLSGLLSSKPGNTLIADSVRAASTLIKQAGNALEEMESEGVVDPLVIIEGRSMSAVEAILVNNANCLFVDWDHIGSDKAKALEVFGPIVKYFHGTDTLPDRKITKILLRLDQINGSEVFNVPADADDGMMEAAIEFYLSGKRDSADTVFDPEKYKAGEPQVVGREEPESVVPSLVAGLKYNGIEHTAGPDCPACKAMEQAREEGTLDSKQVSEGLDIALDRLFSRLFSGPTGSL
jgi:hypothetical protein